MVINGNLTVNGTLNGHAASTGASTPTASALPHADGSQRLTLSMQSPDQIVEDVGEGTLAAGRATVKLDPDFAGLLRGVKYHVFLTPKGDCNGLYVTNESPGGFEVRELKAGTSSVGFSYRLLAKLPRQAGARLERVAADAPSTATQSQADNAPKPVKPLPVPSIVEATPATRK